MKRTKRDNERGFTLVEVMIVVAIIGMLVTMAMPGFVRARDNSQEAICLNNLRMIHTAKTQHAMEAGKTDGDTVNGTDLDPYLKHQFTALVEPAGYVYVIGDVGIDPVCTYGGTHVVYGP
jgi:prepilin-type N-terminal cleavage/methylation domain-containing protein